MTRRYSDFRYPRDVASQGDVIVMVVAAFIFLMMTIVLVYYSTFITAIWKSIR